MNVYTVTIRKRGIVFELELLAASIFVARSRAQRLHPFGYIVSVVQSRDQSSPPESSHS